MNTNIQEIFKKNTTRIKSIAFHPKQTSFITGNHCGMIYVWDLDYCMAVDALIEHQGSVRCISFHPSGELFASCGDDKIVRIWNYKTRSVVMRLKGHTDFVRSVSFHPTQPLLVSGSDDYSVIVWNYYSGEIVKSGIGHKHYVMSTLFLDPETIASASLDHTIIIWQLGDLNSKYISRLELHQTISAHERGINTLYFTDGILVSGSDDKDIKIWKYTKGKLVLSKVFHAPQGNVTCVIKNDKKIIAVTEDGQLYIFKGNDCIKIEHKTRLWAVAKQKNHIIVGSDDGIVLYRNKISCAGIQIENKIFYSSKGRLMYYDIDNQKAKNLCYLKENVKRILPSKKSYVIVEYESVKNKSISYMEYSVNKEIEDDKKNIIKEDVKDGQCAYVNGVYYTLIKKTLFRDGEKCLDDVDGTLIQTDNDIFILNGKKVKNEQGIFTLPFEPLDVISHNDEISFIGRNEIIFYDRNMHQKSIIKERVEITGAFYVKNKNSPLIFVYGTLHNVKYIYCGTGILLSVDEYLKPVGLQNNELYLLNGSEIRRIAVNTIEIEFRKLVCKNGDIIKFINNNNLPGISSLKYLIEHGKGTVALPYINDTTTKFELFVSSKEFKKAYELCCNDKMRDELAFAAMASGNYEIAETCWMEIGNTQNLFYLFLCTKQLDKIAQLNNKNIFAAILCDDKISINNLLGYSIFSSFEVKLDQLSITKDSKNDII